MSSSEVDRSSSLRAQSGFPESGPCKEPTFIYQCDHNLTCKGWRLRYNICIAGSSHGQVVKEKCLQCCEEDSLEQKEQEQPRTYVQPSVLGFAAGQAQSFYIPAPANKTSFPPCRRVKSPVASTFDIIDKKNASAISAAVATLFETKAAKPKEVKGCEEVWEDMKVAAELAEMEMKADEDTDWVVL